MFNLLLKRKSLIETPSTRKPKAREKRSRQSDVMSDIENLNVMLGNYQEVDQVRDEDISNTDFDLESRRPQRETNSISGNFRSILNTNTSENSEITVETSRAINSEISSQMSRKLEEMRSDLNSHILDAIDPTIEEKVIPSIKNALESQNSRKIQIRTFGQMDLIRVLLVKYVRKGTLGQLDLSNKLLEKRPRMLRKTSLG